MGRLSNVVQFWLNQEEITDPNIFTNEDGGYTSYGFFASQDGQAYEIYLDAYDYADTLQVFVYAPSFVPETHRAAVAELIVRINRKGMKIGNIDLDMESGAVRWRLGMMLDDVELSGNIIAKMVAEGVAALDAWWSSIVAVEAGVDVNDAYGVQYQATVQRENSLLQ